MTRHRDVTASPFGQARSRFDAEDGGLDPMSGLANMSDAMLVFACGLMLALIVSFNLDVSPAMTQIEETENMQAVDQDVEDAVTSMSEEGKEYTELGMVYEDSDGKLWMLKKSDESADAGQ